MKKTIHSLLQRTLTLAVTATLTLQAAQAADYPTTVLSDGPLAYYRLNDVPLPDTALNSGSLGTPGNAIYGPGVTHRVAGALAGDIDAAANFGNGGLTASHTYLPYLPALNPASNQPFTIEFWANPAADTSDATGPCPLFNRVTSGNRSGWVFFQRSPGTGWNFRMYSGSGSSVGVDLTGGVNGAGTWSHIVAVWDGSAGRLYVNGALAAGPTTGAYNASTAAVFSVGSYDDGTSNPFNGSMDEVAFYHSALSATQVASHYNTALAAAPATSYKTLVTSDGAVEFLRLDEADPFTDVAINSGSIGLAGDATHFPGMQHQVPGALVGSSDTAAGYSAIDTNSCDGGVPTRLPFNAALNTSTFTIEAWLKPTIDGIANAQCPLYNRRELSPRTGWAFYQRGHATGWNFRAYNGVDSNRSIDLTAGAYAIGTWNHVVATFDGTTANLYVNGSLAQSQAVVGSYAPNTDTIQFCVGGFFDGTSNPFIGSIDEVALYDAPLSAARILAHYQNGTNAARATPYETLIALDTPVEYLRLNEPAKHVAANSGSLGTGANATYVNLTNALAGFLAPAYVGLETNNLGAAFDGVTTYVEILNPPQLSFSGQITLEAWIQPAAAQNNIDADIIAHGYNTEINNEVVLRIENGNYQIGSYDGVTSNAASYAMPAEDAGNGNWVHLAGTYDGTTWRLYRNGIPVANAASAVGSLTGTNANWAIGARGRWSKGAGFPAAGEERVFNGGIDEAAIYNYALSPARIAAHYSVGSYGLHPLTVDRSGNTTTLEWSAGILQQADFVSGPYNDVQNASSPYAVPGGTFIKFYRLRF